MERLPWEVLEDWERREGFPVLTTVDEHGLPNSVWVGSVWLEKGSYFVIGDNHFDKTRHNLQLGGPGCLLFLAPQIRGYQIKGRFEYHAQGPIFERMKRDLLDPKFPGVAAVVLRPGEVWRGAQRLA
jgi:predicted pyridoxine 5'-phosphate oxidase superfamily flavin-nucleotide-binding protein